MNNSMRNDNNLINLGNSGYTLTGKNSHKNHAVLGKNTGNKPTKDNLMKRLNAIDEKQQYNTSLLDLFNKMDENLI